MQRSFLRFTLFALLIAVAGAAHGAGAHETDQFTVPAGRHFADLGDYFNRWAYQAIERGAAAANAEIRAALARHEPADVVAELQSPQRVTLAVRNQWPWSVSQIEAFEETLAAPAIRRRYPGRLVAYGERYAGVYQDAFFPLDIRGLAHVLFFSSTIKVYGVYMGTDKLGHFTAEGIHYYYTYRSALESGMTQADAVAAAVRTGTDGPMSERGMLGMVGNADYSNADLAANFAGFLFYRNLTEPVRIRGATCPPLLVRDGDVWRPAPDARPDHPFFVRFVSDHLDEALNPGYFEPYLRPAMRRNLKSRGAMLAAHYADESGRPRTRAWFDQKLAELRTYWGTDYGHLGAYDELVSIGDSCFGHEGAVVEPPARPAAARFLLSASPSAAGGTLRFGRTALHEAAATGEPEAVDRLLRGGADPRAADDYGTTPLHLACRRDSLIIAEKLLDRGGSVDAASSAGTTPLHEAAGTGDAALVRMLIDHGANTALPDARGRTPADVAKAHGHADLALLLLKGGEPR